MFTYSATQYRGSSLNCTLSAEWDTKRDAALAAKLAYGLTLAEFTMLCEEDKVRTKRGVEIEVSEVKKS